MEAVSASRAPRVLDVTNKAGVTPLIFAASEGWDDCVPLLLEGGASTTAATCMNLLKLPPYESLAMLREKLTYAIEAGAGFELS